MGAVSFCTYTLLNLLYYSISKPVTAYIIDFIIRFEIVAANQVVLKQ